MLRYFALQKEKRILTIMALLKRNANHGKWIFKRDWRRKICFQFIRDALTDFKQLKIGKIFMRPIQALAIDDREIVFACLTNGLFVEFLF